MVLELSAIVRVTACGDSSLLLAHTHVNSWHVGRAGYLEDGTDDDDDGVCDGDDGTDYDGVHEETLRSVCGGQE